MFIGILFGFLAAMFQSISYVCTRIFTSRNKNNTAALLAVSHIIMAVMSIPLVFLLTPENMPEFSKYGFVLFTTSIFYMLGQLFLFAAIIRSEPSRVSPLLGMKIIILALISTAFFDSTFSLYQWSGIFLSCVAVYMLSNTGKKITITIFIFVLLACFCYSLSDLSIKQLVSKFDGIPILKAASFSVAISYILCGIFGIIIFIFYRKNITLRTWKYSLPFAVSWFLAIICLFSCFALIGVVFGNILQSTRGIISIVMGFILVRWGFDQMDAHISRAIFVKRILAAVLMTTAVVLYMAG